MFQYKYFAAQTYLILAVNMYVLCTINYGNKERTKTIHVVIFIRK